MSGSFVSQAGKPSTNVEIIKSCLTAAAKEMCPQKINLSKTLSLLVRTVAQELRKWGATSMVDCKTRERILSGFLWLFALKDVTDSAQFLLFEESMLSLK